MLSEKSVANLYCFLDLTNQGRIKMRHLEQAYRPHLFKLKMELGLEFLTKMIVEISECEEDGIGERLSSGERFIDLK